MQSLINTALQSEKPQSKWFNASKNVGCRLHLPGEPEKTSHFRKFTARSVLHGTELFKSWLKAERLKHLCDFSLLLKANFQSAEFSERAEF